MSQSGEEWQRSYVMVLAERELPIWIGPAEAIVMAMSLESAETPRPFTHKLAASLVAAAGARLVEVRITRLAGEVFYALVIVDGPAGRREIDARPSDAVNRSDTASRISFEDCTMAWPAGRTTAASVTGRRER